MSQNGTVHFLDNEDRLKLKAKIFYAKMQIDNLCELLKLNQIEPDVFLELFQAQESIKRAMGILNGDQE